MGNLSMLGTNYMLTLSKRISAKKGLIAACAIALIGVTACAPDLPTIEDRTRVDIEKLRHAPDAQDPFNRALQREYRAFVNSQALSGSDNIDAAYFARKGFAASKDLTIQPEKTEFWQIPASDRVGLDKDYATLMNALNNGARKQAPALAAKAQVAFDCRVEGLADRPQVRSQCKSSLQSSLEALKVKMASAGEPEPVAQQPQARRTQARQVPPRQTPPAQNWANTSKQIYVILFDSGSTRLSSDAANAMRNLAAELRAYQAVRVTVTGFTDTEGNAAYNQTLSRKRAATVAQVLANNGLPAEFIRVMWQGESNNAYTTSDGQREQANRRVVVEVIASGK